MPAPPPQRAGSLQAAVAVGAETTFLKTINWCGCKKKSIDCKFKTIKNTHLIVNVKRENFNISISDLFNVKVCNCQCFGLKIKDYHVHLSFTRLAELQPVVWLTFIFTN